MKIKKKLFNCEDVTNNKMRACGFIFKTSLKIPKILENLYKKPKRTLQLKHNKIHMDFFKCIKIHKLFENLVVKKVTDDSNGMGSGCSCLKPCILHKIIFFIATHLRNAEKGLWPSTLIQCFYLPGSPLFVA